ncbi:MAG: peptidylprolyl isomerase [Proteobacteria bacterium]|nr:peptidylprolyl isomerase [Pseudomonadota bacterium]
MAQAKQGDTVKVHYTGKLEDGTVFDSSIDRDPLQFEVGTGQVIPGFEQGVVGMSLSELKTIKVQADEAYGPYREEMVVVVDQNQFPADLNIEVGQQLQVNQSEDQKIIVTITDVSESGVTLDANHPLAGKDLTFDIRLIEIV